MNFQYPTTGRGLCHLLLRPRSDPVDVFQYPTTGRGLCHLSGPTSASCSAASTFNTLPRVVGCVTRYTALIDQATERITFNTLPRVVGCVTQVVDCLRGRGPLSIPYHGSWAVSPDAHGAYSPSRGTYLSIPYHGSWAVSPEILPKGRVRRANFQYPTTGRGLCHVDQPPRAHGPRPLSIPYHGSWAVSRLIDAGGRAPQFTFQYPTTGRGLCHLTP